MPKFEQQNIDPVENPREAYEKTEEDETNLKAELADVKSKTADEIMNIAAKLKAIEGNKSELIGIAQEEAEKEEAERKMYDEAKAEDAERTMYDEAKKEDEERTMNDEATAEDVVRTQAKEATKTLEAELENLKSQIAGKSPDEILAIATKMKEIENKKTELQAEKDKQEYDKILEKIKGGNAEQKGEEKVEDIYGLNLQDIGKLLESRGYLDKPVEGNNPDFNRKMEEFHNKQKEYGQARVKLFDRVLSGMATEEEMKLAEEHAATIAKTFGLRGFHSAVPKAWYSNEKLTDAMTEASGKDNKEWIDYVRKNYTEEQLKKGGFEKIGEDGFRHTYNIKGF